ncbi:hypothetical protein Pyn_13297 [Prunus yedoensis var. nudiflora]|uniref:DNA polymerase II subunit 2 n=1 Tax=Prunus yedoensis var. nudiflora TaxID=2094558 RepID=A0A314UUW1_PRUYE|nr:hypothetical protein Pyn_13297 [Prunus yedoensis var. nudiflora]
MMQNEVLWPGGGILPSGSAVQNAPFMSDAPSTEETTDDFEHLVATITHQCHLCPLPLIVQPIIWNYDHSLYLYPTPHTIVLGDRSEQKAFKYTGITCFNPGSFSSDGAFVYTVLTIRKLNCHPYSQNHQLMDKINLFCFSEYADLHYFQI